MDDISPFDGQNPRSYEELRILAAALGRTQESLLVLARQNDPFMAGHPTFRAGGEWFSGQWQRFGGRGTHLRRAPKKRPPQREARR